MAYQGYEDPYASQDPYYYYDNPAPKPDAGDAEVTATPEDAGTPEGPDPWLTAPEDGDWQGWFLRNVQGLTPSSETLVSLKDKLAAHGIELIGNADGSIFDTVKLPNGQMFDVGIGFTSGDPSLMKWGWQSGTGEYTTPDGSTVEIDPSYLTPFEEQFQRPAEAAPLDDFSYADYDAPDPFAPSQFQAPTAESLQNDPSMTFRMDQGRQALETSAAARGLLNSGGTLKDLIDYGQKFASQEYQNAWNRDFSLWDTSNQQNFNAWAANAANDLGEYSTNRGNALDAHGANSAKRNDAYNQAWQQYVERKDTFYKNQTNPFNKLIQASQVGAGAAAS